MPRYEVEVEFTTRGPIKVWARDEVEAAEKAVEIVEGWNGVFYRAEAVSVEER